MSTLGERINYLRKQKKISMEQLALEINTYKGNISKYESGKNDPSIPTLIAISTYFNVSLDWLLTGDELLINNEGDSQLTPEEIELMQGFRNLSPNARREVIAFTKMKADFDFTGAKSSTSGSGGANTTGEKVG